MSSKNLQKLHVLLFKRLFPMMLLLMFDIIHNTVNLRLPILKSTIALLPCKLTYNETLLIYPDRGGSLQLQHQFRYRLIR